jgi:hypothetical protein
MERRTALAFAAAAGGTVLAATAAFVTNVGLLDTSHEAPISVLDSSNLVGDDAPLSQDPTVVTIVVDDPPATTTPAPVSPPAAAPASAAGGDARPDDDVYDDNGEADDEDHAEDEDREDEDREDEDHEIEDDD